MINLLELAEDVTIKITKTVPEIDLVLLYGSVALDTAHPLSDIDMIVITENKSIVWEFVLETNPIKLWSINWNELEQVMKGKSGCWPVGINSYLKAKVIWSKSKKHQERFEAILKLSENANQVVIRESISSFESIYGKLWRFKSYLENNNLVDGSFIIWDIANFLTYTLSGLNNHPYSKNWGEHLPETTNFTIIPDDFQNRYKKLVTLSPKEAYPIAVELIDEMYILMKNWMKENEKESQSTIENVVKEWPSIIEFLNKVKKCAERNDMIGLKYAVNDSIEMIIWSYNVIHGTNWDRNIFYPIENTIMKLSKQIPNKISVVLLSNDKAEIVQALEDIINDLQEELHLRGCSLPIASTLDEAIKFLDVK
jgi:hypothetical protein